MNMLSIEDVMKELPNNSLAKTYTWFTQRLEDLDFGVPSILAFPAVIKNANLFEFADGKAKIFEKLKPKTGVTYISMGSPFGLPWNILESTPYKINPETGLPLNDTDPCEALFKTLQKMFGSDIMIGLDELIVKQAHDTNAYITLTKMANFGLLTQTAFTTRWAAIKNDFKNAVYAARGYHGKVEQEKAKEYLILHPLVLNNLAIDAKSLALFETNWIKTFLKATLFLNKS